jgi:D-3-phosphoglycerate dehydrogenase
VLNVPGANAVAVVELVFGLLLGLFRHIPTADASVHRGEWDKSKLMGRELRGKTLGIVGLGKIGRGVAQRARAFEMTCVGCDPLLTDDAIRAVNVEPLPLDALLPRAEILTLHVPLSIETKGMISAERLARLPRGAILVNAARGGLVDEAALVAALESGAIAGAALDVFASEPPGDSPLARHPRVVATPHIGAATVEAQEAVGEEIVRLLLARMGGG